MKAVFARAPACLLALTLLCTAVAEEGAYGYCGDGSDSGVHAQYFHCRSRPDSPRLSCA